MKYTYLILMLFFTSCLYDMAYEKKIVGNYYLVAANDKKEISVSLRLESGDYIGRVPKVTSYAIADSLLFIRSNSNNQQKYYVLDMSKDHDYAKIEDVVVGPLDSSVFTNKWLINKEVKFISTLD